ncbi:MAG: hypothetical protein OXG43_01600 [Chloroflexi bacterium]|nr:hypothetical protein [Chloroflexota bacterium]
MTTRQKIEVKQSERRERINALLAQEERTDEERSALATLTADYQAGEVELRAAITVEGDGGDGDGDGGGGEDHQLTELRSRVDFGDYIRGALAGHGVTGGAAAEYNQALDVPADRFPLDLLDDGAEHRAAVDGDAGTTQGTWLDRLFADAAAGALGITMPSVPAGVRAYPVIGSNAAPAQRGRTEAAVDATITATVTEVKPTRNSVRAVYSVEDDARLPGLADAIRADLRAAMVEKIDRTIFVGDAGANENSADITGLTTAAIAESTLTQANKIKPDKVLEVLAGFVDGIHAGSLGDVRLVATVGSNTLWLATIAAPDTSNQTLAAFLRENGVTWRTRGEIETATANGDFGAFIGLGRGIANAGVAPVWNSGRLIRDPYTAAKSGEVALTLEYLWNFALPRPASFKRVKYVT